MRSPTSGSTHWCSSRSAASIRLPSCASLRADGAPPHPNQTKSLGPKLGASATRAMRLRHTAVKPSCEDASVNNTTLNLTALRSLKATTDQSGRLMRPARALLGWMNPEDGQRVMVSNRGDAKPTEEQIGAADSAREAVSRRPTFTEQAGAESDLPNELIPHLELLQKTPA